MKRKLLYAIFLLACFLAHAHSAYALNLTSHPEPPLLKKLGRNINSIQVQVVANNNGDSILLCQAGIPTEAVVEIPANVKVGDTLNTGDVILYKGLAPANYNIDNLQANTTCHFIAYSYSSTPDYSFSTLGAELWDRTASTLPIRWDFKTFPTIDELNQVPGFSSLLAKEWNAYKFDQPVDMLSSPVGPACFGAVTNTNINIIELYHDSTDLILPAVFLGAGTHRILFEKAFLTPSNMWGDPTKCRLSESDSLCVQISTSDTSNNSFKTIYTVNNLNYTDESTLYSSNEVIFPGYNNQIVYFRFVFHSNKRILSRLINFKVETIKDCDYPSSVIGIIDSSTANSILVKWVDKEEEASAWEVQYKEEGKDEWSAPLTVNTNPFRISNLPSDRKFTVRVRTLCTSSSVSDWSDPCVAVPTMYGVPFFCNFDKMQNTTAFPFLFAAYKNSAGPFLDTTETCKISMLTKEKYSTTTWQSKVWRSDNTAKYPAVFCPFSKKIAALFVLPALEIPKDEATKFLSFNISVNDGNTVGLTPVLKNDKLRISVLAITDTANFSIQDTLLTFGKGNADLNDMDSVHISLDITHLKENVQFSFLVENDTSAVSAGAGVYITNVAVDYACPAPTNLVSSQISDSSAYLSWTFPKDADFLVAYKKSADTTYIYQNTTTKMAELKKLSSSTLYDVKVAARCTSADTSLFATHTFKTTIPYVCDTVSDIQVAIQTYTATISWEGSGTQYKLIWKKMNASQWDTIQTSAKILTLEGLEEGTQYEYAIQSQCSSSTTDLSVFTHPRRFRTLYITCHTPTNFRVVKVDWNLAGFSYTISDAQGVELLIGKKGSAAEIFKFGLYDTIVVTGLDPQTEYVAKLRSTCGGADLSDYADSVIFTTIAIPPCSPPTNLTSNLDKNNSAVLSWTHDGQIAWYLAYQEGALSWDTVALKTPTYTLNDLKNNTLYSWKVQGECSKYLRSQYSTQANFTAVNTETIINNKEFSVHALQKQLHISNPTARIIDKLEIYNLQGQCLQLHTVGNNGNIILPLDIESEIIIVRLYSQGKRYVYKIIVG